MTGNQLNKWLDNTIAEFDSTAMTNDEWLRAHPYATSCSYYRALEMGRIRGGSRPALESKFQYLDRIYRYNFPGINQPIPVPHLTRGLQSPWRSVAAVVGLYGGYLAILLLNEKIQGARLDRSRQRIAFANYINARFLLDEDFAHITQWHISPDPEKMQIYHGAGIGPDGAPGIQIQWPPGNPFKTWQVGMYSYIKPPVRDLVTVFFFYSKLYSTEFGSFTAHLSMPFADKVFTSGFRSNRQNIRLPHVPYVEGPTPTFPPSHLREILQSGWQFASWTFSLQDGLYQEMVIDSLPRKIHGLPVDVRIRDRDDQPFLYFHSHHHTSGLSESIAIAELAVYNWGDYPEDFRPFPGPCEQERLPSPEPGEPPPGTRGR